MAQKKIPIFLITFFFTTLFFLSGAHAATIRLEPGSASTKVGGTVTISVLIDSKGQALNAVSGVVQIPDALKLQSVSTEGGIFGSFLEQPTVSKPIRFTAVRLESGFNGSGGLVFSFSVRADTVGVYPIKITQVSILAADGVGTELLKEIKTGVVSVENPIVPDKITPIPQATSIGEASIVERLNAPVITSFSSTINQADRVYIRGLANPSAQVKLGVTTLSVDSIGDKVLNFFRSKKIGLDTSYIKADDGGVFEYTSPNYLLAGVYGVTPYEIEKDKEVAGSTVHITINQQTVIGFLVFLVNALALIVPIIFLILIIGFIPWYGKKVMHFFSLWISRKERKLEDK